MILPVPPVKVMASGCTCDKERTAHAHAYTLLAQIGDGGMATVFKAIDHNPPRWYTKRYGDAERHVAVKYLKPDHAARNARSESGLEETEARFFREAKYACDIDHENIVACYNFTEDDEKRLMMVMELVPNPRELRDLITDAQDAFNQGVRRNPITRRVQGSILPLEQVFLFLGQILKALEELHRRKLVHRDLKPENCLIMHERILRVTDLGIVKVLHEEESEPETSSRSLEERKKLTSVGNLIGTPYYMAPEQAGATKIHPETKEQWHVGTYTDLWAFGALAYEMITGQMLFCGSQIYEILSQIVDETKPIPHISDSVEGAPKELEALIDACLQRDPWKRPASATEARHWLEQAQKSYQCSNEIATISQRPSVPLPIKKEVHAFPIAEVESRRLIRITVAGAVALMACVLWFVLRNQDTASTETLATEHGVVPSASITTSSIREEPVMVATAVTVSASTSQMDGVGKQTPDPPPSPSTDAGRWMEEGLQAFEKKNYRIAETRMLLVRMKSPNYPEPYRILALSALRKRDREKAREYARAYANYEGVSVPKELADILK